MRTDREVKKDFEDPAFKLSDIEAQVATLKRETSAIFLTPKPKPPALPPSPDASMVSSPVGTMVSNSAASAIGPQRVARIPLKVEGTLPSYARQPMTARMAGGGDNSPRSNQSYHTDVDAATPVAAYDKSKKYKESDEIKIGPLPQVPQFRGWLNDLRRGVAAASGRPQAAFNWMIGVENQSATFESLANSGDFETMDAKLYTALHANEE